MLPHPQDYLLILAACTGLAGLGKLVFDSGDWMRDLLLGMMLAGVSAAAFAWFAPVAVMPFLKGAVVIGLLGCAREAWRLWRKGAWSWPDRRSLMSMAICAVAAALLFLPFEVHFYTFAEDGVYFIPFLELRLADYVGPLKFAAYWPSLQGASHLAFTTILLGMTALVPQANMLHGIEARYLFIILYFGRVLYLLVSRYDRNRLIYGAICLLLFYLFYNEISACLRTSTMFYLVFLMEYTLIVLFPGEPETGKWKYLFPLIFVSALVSMKSILIQLPLICALYLFFCNIKNITSVRLWLAGVVVGGQTLALLFVPMPFEGLDVLPRLVSLGQFTTNDYFSKFGDGLINKESWLAPLYGPQVGLFAAFALLVGKYVLTAFAGLDRIKERLGDGLDPKLVLSLELYVLTTLASVVLIRNGGHGVTHQVWGVYTISGIVVIIVSRALATLPTRWMAVVVAVAVLYAGLGRHTPWRYLAWPWQPHFAGVTLEQLEQAPHDWLLVRHGDEFPGNVALRALMLNTRLLKGEVPVSYAGPAGVFIIEDPK
ncbi:hypothetical protein [Magnetospirillum gryphiswaldense]|uniref:Membrane protein n=1 Tax=Magnetospirillum gryphiswaldense TaxID=55518 RepID=A4U2V2_9PROT|nr:hypothetical protein [Magnetospirillum gryphiswaldense]AVM75623.1 hypothetical protein MSR1_31570 [Magnetospirillum gryphiswaldense MSR-1]AVM79526.1 hypothetical protein MSR1L_31570 [Magnetospirillum gryphiswaldense]CAM77209.1 membrane protein [Magnetospirillum gryphiswaldense MSR-1]